MRHQISYVRTNPRIVLKKMREQDVNSFGKLMFAMSHKSPWGRIPRENFKR